MGLLQDFVTSRWRGVRARPLWTVTLLLGSFLLAGGAIRKYVDRLIIFRSLNAGQREIPWNGMVVQVGPDYVLSVSSHVLRVLRSSPKQGESVTAVAFVLTGPEARENFSRRHAECHLSSKICRVTAIPIGTEEVQCVIAQAEANELLSFQAGLCRVEDSDIEARYGCRGAECDRLHSIIVEAYRSLGAHTQPRGGEG